MTSAAPSPRRILMTTDTVGGVWNYAVELCRGLDAAHVDVLLATLGPRPNASQRASLADLSHVTLRESDFRLEWMDDPWDDVDRSGEWLLELEREFAPDLIHLNGYSHAALPWNTPVLVVGHSCVLSWWHAVHRTRAPAQWDLYRDNVFRGLHAADHVVAPSAAMLRALNDHYGELRSTEVIPNGANPTSFIHDPSLKENFVLAVGRLWDPAKNISALAHIAPRIPWLIRVAGESAPPGQPSLTFPNLDPLGRREPPELAVLYHRAAIYALPARYEPFGLSILEAAFSGCALVLGDIPSLRELWSDAATFVDPNDTAALETALNTLIADPVRRRALGIHARERATAFTAVRMLSAYQRTYAALSARRPSVVA